MNAAQVARNARNPSALAKGSSYMIGAYMAYALASLNGSLFMAIVLGVALSVLLGVVLESALFSRLYKRDHLEQVLLHVRFDPGLRGVAQPRDGQRRARRRRTGSLQLL